MQSFLVQEKSSCVFVVLKLYFRSIPAVKVLVEHMIPH